MNKLQDWGCIHYVVRSSTASLDEHQITVGDKGHGDGGVTELLHQLAADRLEKPDVRALRYVKMTRLTAANNKLRVSQSIERIAGAKPFNPGGHAKVHMMSQGGSVHLTVQLRAKVL